jgi:transcriptional regulator with XRE-family HTH domain
MERDFQLDWQQIVDEARRRRHERKLPMRRLAAQANVSLPTVLRFEKNERDIQLYSALAILDVLGMVAKPIEGTLLIKGEPGGPYEIRFAPNAGAGGPLESRRAATPAELKELLEQLHADPGTSDHIARAGLGAITGVPLRPSQYARLWPEQFARSVSQSPRP